MDLGLNAWIRTELIDLGLNSLI